MSSLLELFVVATLATLALGQSSNDVVSSLLPTLEKWWGPEGAEGTINTDIRPFKIQFTKEMVEDLRFRINNRRKPTPPLDGVAFEYGVNSNIMDGWMNYWANEYNFTERESFLNQFPQFKVNVQGLDIHYIHVKPQVADNVEIIPLLMLHGWPGSAREFYEAIPLITSAKDLGFAIEVIVPSLPGFGFSDGPTRPGMGQTEIAVILRNFMRQIGFDKFYIQAGDLGALIANNMVTLYPQEIKGYHTNFPVSLAPASMITWFMGSLNPVLQSMVVDASVADRMYPIVSIVLGLVTEMGYLHEQATKPDTVGFAMTDSPMALFAWLMQAFSGGSRKANILKEDGGLRDIFKPEALIDDVMFYWTENKFTTAVRVYADSLNLRTIAMGLDAIPTTVPTCTIHAKDEIIYQSPIMLKAKFTNLLQSTILDTDGHFLALEDPETLAKDVFSALKLFRGFETVNKIFKG